VLIEWPDSAPYFELSWMSTERIWSVDFTKSYADAIEVSELNGSDLYTVFLSVGIFAVDCDSDSDVENFVYL
jgi:hypothetical protein